MTTTTEREAAQEYLRKLFRFFARTQTQGRSQLHTLLSETVATDDALLQLLMDTPASQRRPSLLFAAVNHLLRDRTEHRLAAYYPIHGGDRPVDDQAPAALQAFCAEHADELRELLLTRSTQTNEIRRCFALRLGLSRIAAHWSGPLALLEIGASAGLNLHFDDYGYRLGNRLVQPKDGAPVTLSSVVRGGGPVHELLGELPAVTYRIGADLEPVELSADPEAGPWLEAFIWPEQVRELATLRAAINLSRREPHRLVRADAVQDTARLIAEVPEELPVVVFTASLLSYLDAQARARFIAQLSTAARSRRVAWLFTEAPGLVARTDVTVPGLAGSLRDVGDVYSVGISLRDGAGHQDELLALADPYVEWIAPARTEADDFSWAVAEGLYQPAAATGGGDK
ncbi:DUF2332 domain-containing protein [Kitasatospora sp. NPDC052896]|uniref:DUF2332 domain-containing protein n=1 Tax=Kitasatospora sp. NPDC052896 TaxID=3364061 RepID=UPI0037C82DE1